MDKNTVIIALITIIIGFGGGYLLAGSESEVASHMDAEMQNMVVGLSGKSGDEFDKAFLSEMMVHHQGAVRMAQAAIGSAKHDEIKQMARAIISAQTSEIGQMQQWQKEWYGGSQ